MARPVTPLLAADVVIELTDQPEHPIVLIQRKNPPYGWAIPGGFVDVGETVEDAARREMKEEVSLKVELTGLLGVYSRPDRDPRGHTVTVIYTGEAKGTPVAADDAQAVGWFTRANLPSPLAFDHAEVLDDYFARRN
jgi:8-oxo-dGTP diphosphatase